MKPPEQLKEQWDTYPVLNSAVSVAHAERWDFRHAAQQDSSPVHLKNVTMQCAEWGKLA